MTNRRCNDPNGRALQVIPNPSSTVFLQETYVRVHVCGLRPWKLDPTAPPENATVTWWHDNVSRAYELYSALHDNGGNLLHCDGHAEYRKGSTIRSLDFGLLPPDDTQKTNPTKSYQGAF